MLEGGTGQPLASVAPACSAQDRPSTLSALGTLICSFALAATGGAAGGRGGESMHPCCFVFGFVVFVGQPADEACACLLAGWLACLLAGWLACWLAGCLSVSQSATGRASQLALIYLGRACAAAHLRWGPAAACTPWPTCGPAPWAREPRAGPACVARAN